MIYGIGIDIVEIERIQKAINRFNMSFCYKILHAKELEVMPSLESAHCISWLSARFTAKEAAVKALGTGFRNGISFKSIAVLNNSLGKPELFFFDKALEAYNKREITRSHVSLSHERSNAIAYVVLEID